MGITITGGMSFSGGLTVISPVTGASGSSWIAYLYDAASAYNVWLYNLAVDATGNVYAAGTTQTPGQFRNSILVKYDTDGAIQWQKNLVTGISDSRIAGLAMADGKPVFGGYSGFSNELLIGMGSTSGSVLWSRKFGQTDMNSTIGGRNISVDGSGNVFLTGNAGGYSQIVVAKYDSSGALQWQRSLGGSNSEYNGGTATDSTGAVYVSGQTDASLDPGGNAAYLAKYSSSGTLLWQRYMGDSGFNFSKSVATDSNDNVFLLVNDNNGTATVSKWNSSGTLQWQKYITAGGYGIQANSLAIDSSGNVYVSGYYNTTSLTYAIVVKFDNSGTHQWSRYIGVTNTKQYTGYDIQVDTSGNYYAAIEYVNMSNSRVSTLITKLPTNGTRTGTYTVGSLSLTYGTISLTIGTGTLSSGTPTFPSSTGSQPDVAGGFTTSAGNVSVTTTTIAAS